MSEIVSSAWYADFFTELPNEFWRRVAPPQSAEIEVDFIERELALPPRARILDVPCGSGRHALTLAARGHRVTGVDISTEALGYARRAAVAAGVDIEFVESDMRQVPRAGAFDAAVCLGNSFGYLDLAGTREFVAALAAAVRPGGGLVIDFSAAAETILPGYLRGPRTPLQVGDITVEASIEYDVAGSRMFSRYRFRRGSEELEEKTAVHHVYTSAHLGQLLVDAGFIDVRRFGGPDGAPYELAAERLLLTATRAVRS